MRDLGVASAAGSAGGAPVPLPSAEEVTAFMARLAGGSGAGLSDAERVDFLRASEELKAATEGAQADVALWFDASQRAVQAQSGVRGERQGRGVAMQIGLARRLSHHRATHELATVKAAAAEMPHSYAAFRAGKLSWWRLSLLVRETACLTKENRHLVDVCLAEDTVWLEAQGDRQLIGEARRLAYRFQPRSFVDRHAQAASDRRVTTRPAPDTMVYLTALLPVAQGVAAYAALMRHADCLVNAGDPRTRDQIIADTLVERLTGQASAEAVPVEVGLVISDRTATQMDDEPARIPGYGPIPADLAAHLIRIGHARGLVTLRKLYADPTTGQLVGMDSRSTRFPAGLAALIGLRDDGICRTQYCGAPIRSTDHAQSLAEDGPTSFANAQGACQACNIGKEAIGWKARPRPGPDGQHTIDTVTPTGHRYTSPAPRIRYVHRPPEVIDIYLADDYAAS